MMGVNEMDGEKKPFACYADVCFAVKGISKRKQQQVRIEKSFISRQIPFVVLHVIIRSACCVCTFSFLEEGRGVACTHLCGFPSDEGQKGEGKRVKKDELLQ